MPVAKEPGRNEASHIESLKQSLPLHNPLEADPVRVVFTTREQSPLPSYSHARPAPPHTRRSVA